MNHHLCKNTQHSDSFLPAMKEYLRRDSYKANRFTCTRTGRGSSVGCPSDWYADGRRFDPDVRQHSFVEIGHEILSTVILSLPLIQVGQLSVTGERMYTKYWLIALF